MIRLLYKTYKQVGLAIEVKRQILAAVFQMGAT